MEDIEVFVRKLCSEGDLSILTKKLIRNQYQAHFKKASVTREEREQINKVLDTVIQELAEQSRGQPGLTNVGENANSASLGQGKENLCTDYISLPSTSAPTSLAGQKVVTKVARAELGEQSHLRRIQLSLKFQSRRTSDDSVFGNDGMSAAEEFASAEDADCNEDGGHHSEHTMSSKTPASISFHRKGNTEELKSSNSSNKIQPSTHGFQNKHLTRDSVTLTDHIGSSEDEAMPFLSSCDSNAETNVLGGKQTSIASDIKSSSVVSQKRRRIQQCVSSTSRQKKRAARTFTLENALSVIMESDGSQNSALVADNSPRASEREDEEFSSPLNKPSKVPWSLRVLHSEKDSRSSSVPCQSKVRNKSQCSSVYSRLKIRLAVPTGMIEPKQLSASDGCHVGNVWSEDRDIEDSQDTPLIIDESPKVSDAEELSSSSQSLGVFKSSKTRDKSKDSHRYDCRKKRIIEDSVSQDEQFASDSCVFDELNPSGDSGSEEVSGLNPGIGSEDVRSAGLSTADLSREQRKRARKTKQSVLKLSSDSSSPVQPLKALKSSDARDGSDDCNIYTRLKKRFGLLGQSDSQSKLSAIDSWVSETCSQSCQKSQDISSASIETSSVDMQQTGFAAASFFRKKPKRKTRQLVIESDSDIPQDALLNPELQRLQALSSQDNASEEDNNSDSGIAFLPDMKTDLSVEETAGAEHTDLKRRQSLNSASEADKMKSKGKMKGLNAISSKNVVSPKGKHEHREKAPVKKKLKSGKCVQNGRREKVQTQASSSDSELDDLPLNLLDTFDHHEKVVEPDSDDLPLTKIQTNPVSGLMSKHAECSEEFVKAISACSLPVSHFKKKLVMQNQKGVKGKKISDTKNSSTSDAMPHKKSVYSLSESTEDEAFINQNQRVLVGKHVSSQEERPADAKARGPSQHERSVCSVSESAEDEDCLNENLAFTDKQNFTSGQRTGDISSMRTGQQKYEEPWNAVSYNGEMLKFPVIKLKDIQQTKGILTAANGKENKVISKRERNIFEFLKTSGSGQMEQGKERSDADHVGTLPKSPVLCFPVSKVSNTQKRSVLCAAESNAIFELMQPANLEESRLMLKQQRTVKKMAPKLRTTLKLRKQPSPNKTQSSSEVEEWAVVTQDESELSADNQALEEDSFEQQRLSLKKAKARKRKASSDSSSSSSEEDSQPLKRSTTTVDMSGDDVSSSAEEDYEEATPVKAKKSNQSKSKVLLDSSDDDDDDDDDLPLKPRSTLVQTQHSGRDDGDGEESDATPLKAKKSNRFSANIQLDSSDEDDLPLKPRQKAGLAQDSVVDVDEEGKKSDVTSLKVKKSKKRKIEVLDSSDEDDLPLKSKSSPVQKQGDRKEWKNSDDEAKLQKISSDDDISASEACMNRSGIHGSDLDTSSLSSDDENEVLSKPTKRSVLTIKVSRKKGHNASQNGTKKRLHTKEKGSKREKPSGADKDETPYLKRLRVICRKVGIFVRNDIHFVGCTTDSQKIERLKEALKAAGMKGQPSLSKVDSVNLKREAEALDTANIIETSGRPKRQSKSKDVFARSNSPKKSLTPVKEQFSRIRDLISESESDSD